MKQEDGAALQKLREDFEWLKTEVLARKVLTDALIAVLVDQKILSGDAAETIEDKYMALAQKMYQPRADDLLEWLQNESPLKALQALGLENSLDR